MALTAGRIEELRAQLCVENVHKAKETLEGHLPRTPLYRHPLLVEALGLEVYIKHENHLPTGAFKIRGGINYMANLDVERKEAGVVTATRGNHGQSIALASSIFAVRCVIVVPHGNNPEKNDAMRAYGAELIEHGKDFDQAREMVEELVAKEGLTYVHSANEPDLINGVGTYSLEIFEELPELDAVVIPVGGGSGICGASTVFRALKPEVKIIGVQAENAPSIYDSWKKGEITPSESANTFADGLATRIPFELPFEVMRTGVDDMLLVSEEEIRDAIKLLLRTTHNLAEGAAAAALAAIAQHKDRFQGQTVATPLTGGNIDTDTLRWVLSQND